MTRRIREARSRAGHRLRSGVLLVHKAHKKTRGFWVSCGLIGGAAGVLAYYMYVGVHDGTLHHLALAILAERVALGFGGGE